MDVLSVWWIVLLVDLSVVYAFWKLANKKQTNNYLQKNDLPDNYIP